MFKIWMLLFLLGPALYTEYVSGFKNATSSIESKTDMAGYHYGVTCKYSIMDYGI